MAKVNIIINCHNGERYLQKTLDSIQRQTYADYEIIFWDNCSTDATPEIARRFGERLRYYRGERFVTLGEARNLALEKAEAPYIAFADSDDLWKPEKLQKQVEVMEQNPQCGLSFTGFIRWNEERNEKKPGIGHPLPPFLSFDDFLCNYNYSLSSFLIRRQALGDFRFDTRLNYAEEYDLFCKIVHSRQAAYLSEELAVYRIHSSMTTMHMSADIPKEYDIVLNNFRNLETDFDQKHPKAVKRIEYLRDFGKAKLYLSQGKNRESRNCIRPHLSEGKKAKLCYGLSLFPTFLSKKLLAAFFRGKVLVS